MFILEYKKSLEDDGIFFRFNLNIETQFWFTWYENRTFDVHINHSFPVSRAKIYLYVMADDNKLDSNYEINTVSLNGNSDCVKLFIKEVESACEIAEEICKFFKADFKEKYLKQE